MPIFEYRCLDCGEEFEKFVRSTQVAVEIQCPRCQSEEVRKAFSVFGTRGVSTSTAGSAADCGPVG